MFRRQLFKRLIDAPAELGADGLLIGVSAWSRQAVDFVCGILTTQDLMASLATAKINREVSGDAIEPSREARARLELGEVLISANKGLLGQFNRVILIVYDSLRDPDHAPLIAFDQCPKSLRVTIPSPLEQLGFVGLGSQCSSQLPHTDAVWV